MKRLALPLLVGLIVLAIAPAVFCDGDLVLPPVITGDIVDVPGIGQFSYEVPLDEFELDVESGKWKLKGALEFLGILDGTTNLVLEEIEFDPDPSLTLSMTWTNVSPNVLNYNFNVTQPALLAAPNLMLGTSGIGVIDAGSDGATMAALPGSSIYSALIDGTVVQTLQDDPFTLTAPPYFSNTDDQSFGPLVNNLPVTQDIGISMNFSLTPNGDMADALARFVVIPIPEPGSMALIGIGLLALMRKK